MCEIKFRGMTTNGEWVYGTVEFHLVDGDLTKTKQKAFITYDDMDAIGKVYRHTVEIIPKTVGQYTGFMDDAENIIGEEDKEVYKGDIVEFEFEDRTLEGEVKFEEGMFIVCNNALSDSYLPLYKISESDGRYSWITGRVVGNIHESEDM